MEDLIDFSNLTGAFGQPNNEILFKINPVNAVFISSKMAEIDLGLRKLDQVMIYYDKYNNKYKCFPIRVMEKHEAVRDVIYESRLGESSAKIIQITITYCPLSQSGVIYEGIWRASGLLYNSTLVLTNDDKNYLLPQMIGKTFDKEKIFNKPRHNNYNLMEMSDDEDYYVNSNVNSVYPYSHNKNIRKFNVLRTTWGEWRSSSKASDTIVLRGNLQKDYSGNLNYKNYFGSNKILFPVNSIGISLRRQYSNHTMGFGIFNIDNEGVLFIRYQTLVKNKDDGVYEGLINVRNLKFIECYIFAWLSHFPNSKVN